VTTHAACAVVAALVGALLPPSVAGADEQPIGSVPVVATLALGRTADWVAIGEGAVWVGSTGPDAVHRIDPRENTLTATVPVPGTPCAGLATGFGAVWVPLCARPNVLARIDAATLAVQRYPGIGPAAREGGITISPDSVWLVTDVRGTLSRIDPASGRVRQTVRVPAGSFNPRYADGVVWVSRATGHEVTAVDAASGRVLGHVATGPEPRFLAAGEGLVYTLNQGDGTLTRIDARRRRAMAQIALHTPGHGGDVALADGIVWTTMAGVPLAATAVADDSVRRRWLGEGGDSLAVADGSVWLTDYHRGTVARILVSALLGPRPPGAR
jgi:streptogramin lyase